MPDPLETITYEFEFGRLYHVVPVDGIFGGVTHHGRVFAALYVEHLSLPDVVEHGLIRTSQGSGRIGPEVSRLGGDATLRYVEVGVSMDPAVARSVGHWLIAQADAADEPAGGEGPGGAGRP